MQERRAETRYLCSDLVRLLWSDGQRERDETVVLENISASGACVQAEFPLDENTRVRLVCRKQEFHGYIRSCYWRDDGYFLGIAFDADSQWSKAKYKPEHLLDPAEVKPRRPKSLVMCEGVWGIGQPLTVAMDRWDYFFFQPAPSSASLATFAVLVWMVTVSSR